MKTRLLTLFAIALMPGLLYAGTACATPTVVPADGRVVDFDFVANSPGANFYQFDVSAGNSYSVEVRQDYDDLQATNDLTTTAFSDVGCSAAVVVRSIVTMASVLPEAWGDRRSSRSAGSLRSRLRSLARH